MPVSPELLSRARRGRRDAVVELLTQHYPGVYRVAFALTGREDVGHGVVRFVIRRSLDAITKWESPGDPPRWFMHHTLLTARRAARHEPDLAGDPLIRGVETTSAYYPAFIRALRAMPMQQREAFILHHGERLDIRRLAIAMDCSTEATANHLREATAALTAYAGDYFPTFTAQLAQTYARLAPLENDIIPVVRARVQRYLWPRRLIRITKRMLKLTIIAGMVFVIWKVCPLLRW